MAAANPYRRPRPPDCCRPVTVINGRKDFGRKTGAPRCATGSGRESRRDGGYTTPRNEDRKSMKSEIVTQNPAIGIECVLRFYVRPAGTSSGDALLNYFGPARCLLPFLPICFRSSPRAGRPEGVPKECRAVCAVAHWVTECYPLRLPLFSQFSETLLYFPRRRLKGAHFSPSHS